MNWWGKVKSYFVFDPIEFTLGEKVSHPIAFEHGNIPVVGKRGGYNLDPKDLYNLSKSDVKRLHERLTYYLHKVDTAIFDGEVPLDFREHTECVKHSLMCYKLLRERGLPARLATVWVKVPTLGRNRFERHMVCECRGMILDSYGNQYACAPNTRLTYHWRNISGYELEDPWHRIEPDDRLWYYREFV